MGNEKKPRARKSFADRLSFVDGQIAESKKWTEELESRRAAMVQAERERLAAEAAGLGLRVVE